LLAKLSASPAAHEGRLSAVGPTAGRSPYRGMHEDRAAEAYEARSRWLENRWLDHREPAVPGGGT
jgi:hypothetical protein